MLLLTDCTGIATVRIVQRLFAAEVGVAMTTAASVLRLGGLWGPCIPVHA